MSSLQSPGSRGILGRVARVAGAVLLSAVTGLATAEITLRWRVKETPWTPGPQMQAVQALLLPHPTLGFLWRPDVRWESNVMLPWADQVVEPLSTDAEGFRNAPGALAARAAGRAPDVVGLGDSYVHDAAYVWHEAFARHGLGYYNRGMHRHCPPQYNIALRDYALPLRPRRVVYGVYENDFLETMDYEDWRRSGLDWFAFHSGVWAGPAGSPDRAERWFRRNLRGLYSVYRMAKARQRREAALARWEREIPSRVVRYTLEAHAAATAAGVGFLAVLVPFKPEGDPPTFDDATYDAFAARLRESGVPTLDLRPIFAAHRDPRSLFYRMDSHWNPDGMRLAADAIAAAILAAPGD